ncbi:Retrovirus-related Pol polyprotein from transposon [Smittium culicis]|uniref:Retrovirus-related Pol polyprotein from transposon n=1 Tax=Smittium culicis TaxID=133412 RepID=A0A1R1YLB4_9FUNG|nr:Retrovirus-related Pol polyprotein from transposon [Smittium culicis]
MGIATTFNIMRLRCWWPGMREHITHIINHCPQCQITGKNKSTIAPLNPLIPANNAFFRWGIDFIGQMPTTYKGNKWIILAIDHQTNWILAEAAKDSRANTVASFLYEKMFLKFGNPIEIISDRGAQFTSDALKECLHIQKFNHNLTSAYHPMSNGKTERVNGIIGSALTKLAYNNKYKWNAYLDQAVWATRIRKHSRTQISPYFLVYGVDPRIHGDDSMALISYLDEKNSNDSHSTSARLNAANHARMFAREQQIMAAKRMKSIYDKNANTSKYPINSWVTMTNETRQKLNPKVLGPYKIIYHGPFYTYKLMTAKGEPLQILVNHNRL